MHGLLKQSIVLLAVSVMCSQAGFAADTPTNATDNSNPKFDCTLTDQVSSDQTAGPAKSTFTKTTPAIHLVCSSDSVQKGQKIKAVWIAADTHKAAPDNYKIDEKAVDVPDEVTDGKTFDTDFSLSKPTNGWPLGSYHVDIYVNDQFIQSTKFNVQ